MEIVEQATISAGLFDRVQVGALQVFDEREDEHCPVVELANDGGDFGPAKVGGGAQSPFAGDEFVGVPGASKRDGLQETGCFQRRLELSQLVFVEGAPWLKGIRPNSGNLD